MLSVVYPTSFHKWQVQKNFDPKLSGSTLQGGASSASPGVISAPARAVFAQFDKKGFNWEQLSPRSLSEEAATVQK